MKVTDTKSFIEKAKSKHGDKYDYSNTVYYKSKEKLEIICKTHGKFEQVAAEHLKGYGCSKCSKKYKPTLEEWIERAKLIHGDTYDYSKAVYIDNKTPIEVICKEHGSFYPIPNNHLKGSGCSKCDYIRRHFKYKKSTEQFILEASIIHNNKYDYSKVDYYNKSKNVCIICPKHGEFWQDPSSHLNGSGCSKCLLKNQTILFEKLKFSFKNSLIKWEQSIEWLGKQRFDIYFPEYNIAIEYNGIQHYEPVKIFGGEEKFLETLERDNLKRQKCLDNNCTLFEVKYDYNDNDYEELVNNIQFLIDKQNEIN